MKEEAKTKNCDTCDFLMGAGCPDEADDMVPVTTTGICKKNGKRIEYPAGYTCGAWDNK